MALDPFLADIPLATGINTRDDSKMLPPLRLLDLQNAVLSKGGALKKRNGSTDLGRYTLATSPELVGAARALAVRDNELVLLDGQSLLSYSEASRAWSDRGPVQQYATLVDVVANSTDRQTSPDCAVADGITVFAWESGNDVHYAVYDTESGSALHAPTLLATDAARPRCVAVGDTVLILFIDTLNQDIAFKRLAAADLANTVAALTAAFGYGDVQPAGPLDAVSIGDSAVWCCRTTADAGRVGMVVASGVGGPGSNCRLPQDFDTGNVTGNVMALDASSSALLGALIYQTGAGLRQKSLTVSAPPGSITTAAAGSLVTADTAVATTCLHSSSGVAHVWWEVAGGSPYLNLTKYALSNAGSLSGQATTRHASLGSHAFALDGVPRVHLHHNSTLQGTYFLVDTEGYPAGRILAGTGVGRDTSHLPRVTSHASGEYLWAATFKHRLQSTDGSVYTQPGIARVTYDVDSQHADSRVDYQGTLLLGGGLVWSYDGESSVESGFLLFPENVTGTPASSTGSMSPSGSYFYTVYWEWFNAQGDREQSTAGQVFEVVMGASDDQVTLVIPTLAMTWKRGDRRNVCLAVYRSALDGTTRNRVTSLDPDDAELAANGYVANNPAADTVTFVDRLSDAAILDNELDYQNGAGGVAQLANLAPPALRGLGLAQGRVWGVSVENRRRVYFTKLATDEVALSWAESNYLDMPREILGVSELSGQPVFFAEDAIYFVNGDGPDNLNFGSFGRVEQVPNDVGLAEPRTLVRCPVGIAFKSRKGFWLLGNNLQLQFVGSDVQGYVDDTYYGAESLTDANEVRFISENRTLVFDHERGQWSTFTRVEGVASVLWKGRYCYAQADGLVRQETPGEYRDSGNGIAISLTTAWFKPAESIQGFGRVRMLLILGQYIGVHRLRVEVGYNYENAFRETFEVEPENFIETATWGSASTWGSSTVWGGSGETEVYQARRVLPIQKCQSIRFRITEIPGEDGGEGLELNLLTLAGGRKQGPMRLAEQRTV